MMLLMETSILGAPCAGQFYQRRAASRDKAGRWRTTGFHLSWCKDWKLHRRNHAPDIILIYMCRTFTKYHLVALGAIPVVHLLDPVVRLDGGQLVGVALPGVHRVQRQVLLQGGVLLEEQGKVCEGGGIVCPLCSVEQRLIIPID